MQISCTTLLIIVWFSFFLNLFLGMGSLPRSLVVWSSDYLVPNLPKTLHSSEKCTAPWIIQVFDALFKQSTYRLWRLPDLPSFAGWVFDDAASPILLLLSPVWWASARLVFYKKVLPHLHKYFQQFPYAQKY